MALAFRDSEALEVAIRSGLCPREIAAAPARIACSSTGAIVVAPDPSLTTAALAKLRAAGVAIDASLPSGVRTVRCWAEALAPQPRAVGTLPSLVLFVTQRALDLIDVAAELVRLGCDRQELTIAGDVGVIRVVDPPTYTVVRALDRERGLRVFAPDPPGQDRVWTELGFHHRLADHLRADPGTLLLIGQERWTAIRDEGWMALDAALEIVVPGHAPPHLASRMPERRRIELRLSSGRREVPSLWVLRHGAIAAIDKLLEYLPEEIVARLTFAVTGEPTPTVILRARTGRHPAPDLSLAAEEYAPLAGMPDIYAPAGALVEPPLRRERLRSILGIEPRQVLWLTRTEGPRFRVERIADDAFTPLSEWADYVLHTSAQTLVPWMRASVYDFAPFVSTGLEWASERPADKTDDDATTGPRKRGRLSRAAAPADTPLQRALAPKPAEMTLPSPDALGAPTADVPIDAELAALEAEFIALDAPADAPERLALLEQLARTYGRLGRRRDAGLCFARAVWESPPAEAQARLDAWIAADLGSTPVERALDAALALAMPSGHDVRSVAALTARPVPAVAKDPHRVSRWLDDHDGELDARSLWLSRLALARLSDGDPLLLAHARDRILSRLAGGLPVDRELPAFLRLAGRSGALGNANGEQLANALHDLARRLDSIKRKRTTLEAPVHLTNAYVSLLFAYGFARLGNLESARTYVASARKALQPVGDDPVHGYLLAAYAARVDQAIAGLPSETPLSDELAGRLAALDRMGRYKVDRLRDVSRILEPLEQANPFGTFLRAAKDARGPEFAALREITDPIKRAKAVDKLVDTATRDAAERGRLLDGVFDVLLVLPESGAVPILIRAWKLITQVEEGRRAALYAEALVVAGHFGRTEMVPPMLDALGDAIQLVPGADLNRVLQHSLRALRRIGLRTETAELLARVEHAMPADQNDALRGRLALAAGLAYLGESSRALPIFEHARAALRVETMRPQVKLQVTRALALAYAQAPLQHALGGLTELAAEFRDVSDNFNTNSHFCLSVLDFVESIVLGITSDDLALGEAGRRFIEDDEHLIRRRLHRDLGGNS